MLQAYDKEGRKLPFALEKTDYVIDDSKPNSDEPKSEVSVDAIVSVPRYCISEIVVYDNQTHTEHVLGGGYNTDLLSMVEREFDIAIKKIRLMAH